MVKSLKFPILPVVLGYAVMHDQLCMMRALFDTSFTTTAVALLLDLATAQQQQEEEEAICLATSR